MGIQDIGTVLLDHASEDKEDFWMQIEPPFECQVQKENGEWVDPFRIGFGIKAKAEETKTNSKTVQYQNTVSTLAVGKLKSGTLELFLEEKPDQPPKISSQINKNFG